MATLEERTAFLEGRIVEHARMLDGIREAIVSLEARMDRRFEAVDRRFENLERRVDALDQKLDQRTGALDQRIDGLDAKMSRQFTWLVGIQVTTLAAIVAALVSR